MRCTLCVLTCPSTCPPSLSPVCLSLPPPPGSPPFPYTTLFRSRRGARRRHCLSHRGPEGARLVPGHVQEQAERLPVLGEIGNAGVERLAEIGRASCRERVESRGGAGGIDRQARATGDMSKGTSEHTTYNA